ncbi:hypothetical protein LSUE1_G004142 [Lachnellula suecica]|uniref:Integral membrane protein n=1 Tax=Lachnellula suecica TaxID=602035 RepID=A0A8T9C5T2_9HELO|nr:hypothetical protein LSUE1_G004142 [Lachnellula suecica]
MDDKSPQGSSDADAMPQAPPSSHLSIKRNAGFLHRVKLMCTKFPVRDSSWWVGVTFTVGSTAFVINGFFLFLPLEAPESIFAGEAAYGVPISGVIGGLVFVLGGWSTFLEGLNLKQERNVIMTAGVIVDDVEVPEKNGGKSIDVESSPKYVSESDHEPMRHSASPSASIRQTLDTSIAPGLAMIGSPAFLWYPSMRQFRKTYWSDMCFLSGLVTFIGTWIFLVGVLTSVPGVIDFTNIPLFYGSSLFPTTFGGVLFITASVMQMLSVQRKWYIPEPLHLDWHVGFVNLIGSVGFLLAGALPYIGTEEATRQSALSSLWGSWAFLVGSFLQWYWAMENYC